MAHALTTEPSLLLINGSDFEPSDGYFETMDPARNVPLGVVARAGERDVNEAVESAQGGFETWRRVKPVERSRVLLKIANGIKGEADLLARMESSDTGKPLSQARTDVEVSARYFEFYAGLADKLMGSSIPLGDEYFDYTVREPIGVSAQIVAWNYPLQIASRGIAPALAAGCAVVVKPASEAPLSVMRLGRIALAAGLPPGVMNVITGPGGSVGTALASHPQINQITFTGSVETGTAVMSCAAQNCVPLILELGGKSPNVLFEDTDLDAALPVVLRAILQNAGQTCSAGSRLLVHASIADEVLERLAEKMGQVSIGPGEDDPDLGPLISQRQLQSVDAHLAHAKSEGVEVLAGGEAALEPSRTYGGFYYAPTLVRAAPGAAIVRNEVFGPVLTATTFSSDAEAVELANATEYGLVAGVWTRDISRAHAVAREIRSGQVFVNGYGAGGGVELPFGGFKKSGFGREKGLEGVNSYLQTKNVCIKLG